MKRLGWNIWRGKLTSDFHCGTGLDGDGYLAKMGRVTIPERTDCMVPIPSCPQSGAGFVTNTVGRRFCTSKTYWSYVSVQRDMGLRTMEELGKEFARVVLAQNTA